MEKHDVGNWLGHAISAGAIIGTLAGWVPVIAALVALVWYVIQISESATVRRWLAARRTRKIERLRAKLARAEHIAKLFPLDGD